MAEKSIRMGKKRFYDNKAFPHGFSKSGNFTIAEDELLTYYGETMLALESGLLAPETDEERHFVEVMSQPDAAATKMEKTWLKYIKFARGRKTFHTLNSKKPVAEDSATEVYVDPELDD